MKREYEKMCVTPLGIEPFARKYTGLFLEVIDIDLAAVILQSSVESESLIQSVGQEKGQSYDFSESLDGMSTFNHDWDGSN